MRTFTLSLILLHALADAEGATPLTLTPETVNEGCAQSWQLTLDEGRTMMSIQGLELQLPQQSMAQVKHCRIAWKPLITAGCYARSARLNIRGRLMVNVSPPTSLRAQLRLSHDLLGQGNSGSFKSLDVEQGPFQVSIEIPEERFLEHWDEVKLVSHLTLYLRQIHEEPNPTLPDKPRAVGSFAIDSLELDSLLSRDCPRKSNP